jgi:TetR/AcrR family transcriptional regulator
MGRKEEIRAAVERIAAEHGSRGVTTARIAAETGVSGAALFKHYRSMEMLVGAALDEASRAVLDLLPDPASGAALERIALFLRALFDLLDARPGYYRLLFQGDLVAGSRRLAEKLELITLRLQSELKAMALEAIGHGALRADTDPERLALALLGCVHAVCASRMLTGRPQSLRQAGMAMARLTIQGSLT